MPELFEYECPACGGAISFDSSIQKLKCPYCDTEFEIDSLAAYDEDVKSDSDDSMDWNTDGSNQWSEADSDGLCSYICRSCGGEIIGDNTVSATTCPFCDNPVIMTGNVSGVLKPDLVIPFKIDKKAAKEALKNHYKKKRLIPKVFKDENHLDEIRGIYVPFWLFDADTDASIRYKATRTSAWSDSKFNYTKTSYYSVTRKGTISFCNVPVDGSSKMDDALMESIEPYDLSQAVDFRTAYLAGYLANRYDVSSEESISRANFRIKKTTEDEFASTVTGYSSVIPEHSSVSLTNGTAKYALLPVWILNTSWNGEKYTFAMNGQTGKFVGDLPLDKAAYRRWLFGLAAAFSAAAFLVSFLIWLI